MTAENRVPGDLVVAAQDLYFFRVRAHVKAGTPLLVLGDCESDVFTHTVVVLYCGVLHPVSMEFIKKVR